jgi:Phosphotransferase enzyme family
VSGTDLPFAIGDITPEWLTDVLTGSGTLAGARIVSCRHEAVPGGSGLFGTVERLVPGYDAAAPDAPASIIVKIPVADEGPRSIGLALRIYEREVRFYRDLAQHVPLTTPRCFLARMDPERGRFILLLEDLSGRRLGDQVAGWSEAEAEIAVNELARLHASAWGERGLSAYDWLPVANAPELLGLIQAGYRQCWAPFAAHFGDHLPPPILKAGEALGSKLPALAEMLARPPRTLVHGDYRMDNMIFGVDPNDPPFSIIDWQLVVRARGVFDFAYFMAQGGDPERRKANEMRLLKRYHALLVENGLEGYGHDQCLLDYRASILYGLVYIVISVGSLENADPRMQQLFGLALERTVRAIDDLDATELMPR